MGVIPRIISGFLSFRMSICHYLLLSFAWDGAGGERMRSRAWFWKNLHLLKGAFGLLCPRSRGLLPHGPGRDPNVGLRTAAPGGMRRRFPGAARLYGGCVINSAWDLRPSQGPHSGRCPGPDAAVSHGSRSRPASQRPGMDTEPRNAGPPMGLGTKKPPKRGAVNSAFEWCVVEGEPYPPPERGAGAIPSGGRWISSEACRPEDSAGAARGAGWGWRRPGTAGPPQTG